MCLKSKDSVGCCSLAVPVSAVFPHMHPLLPCTEGKETSLALVLLQVVMVGTG